MIQVTQRQEEMVAELMEKRRMRGVKINTRILYELWPQLFGIKKRPNGCNACLRADMNQFLTKWEQLAKDGEIEVID